MSMPSELSLVFNDEVKDHPKLPSVFLAPCFFWGEYLAKNDVENLKKKGGELPEANQLIHDFKMKMDQHSTPQWENKMIATVRIAAAFSRGFEWHDIMKTKKAALIPIPPSKSRSDPLYDQRMLNVLRWMREITGLELDVRDCLVFDGVAEASHTSAKRPSEADLFQMLNFNFAVGKSNEPPDTIYLFDDVLTTGSHFSAAFQLLTKVFPNASITGVFAVRRRIVRE